MPEIIILSFIQGIAEFLPISSSGHLILLPYILSMNPHNIEMDVALHMGTLLAIVIYFFNDFLKIAKSFFSYIFIPHLRNDDCEKNRACLGGCIIISTIPIVIAGFIVKKFMNMDILKTPYFIAINGILWAGILFLSDLKPLKRKLNHLTFLDACIIGVVQVFSLLPGSSRSGTCITAARFLGFDRITSLYYAFLISVPPVFGAFILVFYDALNDGIQTPIFHLVIGGMIAFLIGIICIHFVLNYMKRHTFSVFVYYRIFLGIVIIIYHLRQLPFLN